MKLTRAQYVAVLALIALSAATLVLLATRFGVATSSDSARYIRSARHVLGREPETPIRIEAPAEQAHFPPLYPSVLAVLSLGGADPLDAARWLCAALIIANCIASAELVRRVTSSNAAALVTAAIVAFTPGSLSYHCWALSEPLYIFLSLLSFHFLLSHLKEPRARNLIIAAMFTGAAMLTRYAGAALIPAGALVLLLLQPKRIGKGRWIDAFVFAGVAAILPLAWSIRNRIMLGSTTNRVIAFHPVRGAHLIDLAQVCWKWLGADEPVHALLTFTAALIAAGVLVAAFAIANRRANPPAQLAGVMLIYIAAFGMMLAFSISFVDFHTPIDDRVLAPLYIAWVVLVGCVVAPMLALPLAASRITVLLLMILLFSWNTTRSITMVREFFTNGGGFAQRSWRESGIIAAIKQLPPEQIVYTNAPGAVYLLTHHAQIITFPSKFSASSQLPDPEYDANMTEMTTSLHARQGVLVYLSRYGKSRGPADAQLGRDLGLRPILRQKQDVIYDYAPPSTTPVPSSAPAPH